MNLNNKRKKYPKIDRETGSDEIFGLLVDKSSDLKDDIDNLMNDSETEFVLEESLENELDSDDEPLNLLVPSETEFVLEESLENELDSDDEPLNLLVPEANYNVVENPAIEKTLEEGSCKAVKKVKVESKK